jgi:DNA-binding transcriptional LysR family regulator
MDWRSVNFDWNRARAFLVTAEEGSFSAAARALATTQPTIGRQVAALEDELGVTLFARTGTRLELTPTGLALVEHVRAMGEAATRVSLSATGNVESVEGNVVVTASQAISAYLLPPVLRDLRRDLPGIEVELVVSNEARDLRKREADIAIRNFVTQQPDLIAKKIRDTQAHWYASMDYLERVGPIHLDDLAKLELFAFDRTSMMLEAFQAMGLELVREQFPIATGDHLVQWELCKAGVGICVMMEEIGDVEPQVRRVHPDLPPIPIPLSLVTHEELRTSRRIRLVFDRLAEGLK